MNYKEFLENVDYGFIVKNGNKKFLNRKSLRV